MGYLFIDHRGGVDPVTLRDGKLQEYDTVPCRHCRAVIKIVVRGVSRAYDTKHSCDRCCGPICNACAAAMAHTNSCPGPVLAQIERAQKGIRADEAFSLAIGKGLS